MKKIFLILIATFAVTIMSCKKLDDMNIDEKSATEVPSETLFSNALRNLADQESTPSVNYNIFRAIAQYWTETTYPDESNYDLTTRAIPDYEFRTAYRDILSNLKEAKRVIASESAIISTTAKKNNKTAVTEILSVYVFQREVDIFGDIPYSQSLDIDNILPAYDRSEAIYAALFERLDAAIALIDPTEAGFENGDLVYGGDMGKWLTFANSLKLKMAVGVADVTSLNPGARALAAVSAGVMTSAADNAYFTYLAESPNTNQLYVELVASGRYDWVPANTIVDLMDSLNDPRMPAYFDDNLGAGIYAGGIYGDNNIYDDYSHITPTIQVPDYHGILMTASEILFYMAEAASRGFITGSAETYYNDAITSSIVDDWGLTAGDAATYLAEPDVAFTTAPGSELERIGRQSWIASYDRGFLGWTTWRRLDSPILNIPVLSGLPVPKRFTYPANEQTLNGSNYSAAAIQMGGDVQTNRIFWDKY